MTSHRRGHPDAGAWIAFAAAALLVVALLLVVSVALVRLDRAERRARLEAEREAAIGLALWSMDSWLEPFLAREAARPYFDYLPYIPQERAYNRILNRIEPGEVLTPSPLLVFDAPEISVHFEVDATGTVTSPQVPEGNLRDLAEATLLPEGRLEAKAAALARVAPALADRALVETELASGLARQTALLEAPDAYANQLQTRAERWVRTQPGAPVASSANVDVGALVPTWLEGAETPTLVFMRIVTLGQERRLQGFALDWPATERVLLEQSCDIVPDAKLMPTTADADPAGAGGAGRLLALLPAALVPPAAPFPGAMPSAGTLGLLATAWMLLGVALTATGLTLRASRADAERRARFASAVTHELRTPLTTFRMYAEMLDEGMVPEAKRAEYLACLREESNRLAALVENVLAYARLERGTAELALVALPLRAALDRMRPGLERQLRAAGMTLEIASPEPDLIVRADGAALEQIIGNLVDNACKYAGAGALHISTHRPAGADGEAAIRVRDDGPGIAADAERAIFEPFARSTTGSAPGVGLGLAIARGLAQRMGGNLLLERTSGSERGAYFVLTLPVESRVR